MSELQLTATSTQQCCLQRALTQNVLFYVVVVGGGGGIGAVLFCFCFYFKKNVQASPTSLRFLIS